MSTFSSSAAVRASRCRSLTLLAALLLVDYYAITNSVNALVNAFHPSSDVLFFAANSKTNCLTRRRRSWNGIAGVVTTPATTTTTTTTTTSLFMGKLRSKQADLQKKMMMAKKMKEEQQQQSTVAGDPPSTSSLSSFKDTSSSVRLSDVEMKEQNDRKRFEELLATSTVSNKEDYLNEEQELENIDAYRKYNVFCCTPPL